MIDSSLLARLKAALPGDALVAGEGLAGRTEDWMHRQPMRSALLLRPASTGEVSAALALCHAAGQPVITHGGLTGLVHGADTAPTDVVLSLERMRRIESIDPLQRVAVVGAGVTLQQLQEAAEEQGLAFPLDLGARGSATLGGNASTNAGGNRVLRFGMTREMVLGLEAVLADGTVIPAMNRLIKNNSGYDLKQIFIGSEGTLGVITRLVLRLREKPARQDVAFAAVPGFDALAALLKHMDRSLGGGLSAFEVMWPEFYQLVTTPPARGRAPVPHGSPYYVLIESMGGDAAGDGERFQSAFEKAVQDGLVADAVVARSQAEIAAIWALRDDVLQTARWGLPFAFDVSLPIADMPAYVERVSSDLRARWPDVRAYVFGHMGDGNLHLVISPDGLPADARPAVERIVYAPLEQIGGAISAEHGIGLEKKAWLPISRSPAEIALMRTLKQALDPKGILNPGRVI
ncbi:MAG: FAD-binding oxidoreductase [Betaproteobacteria bacterium]|nr:FAD-binding oxidoreductase [Betaproteobacteria bacterium]